MRLYSSDAPTRIVEVVWLVRETCNLGREMPVVAVWYKMPGRHTWPTLQGGLIVRWRHDPGSLDGYVGWVESWNCERTFGVAVDDARQCVRVGRRYEIVRTGNG